MVILVRRWRWVLASGLLAGVGVLAALPFLTPQYEIHASLLYKLGREQTPPQISGVPQTQAAFKRPEDVASEIEILKRQSLVEELVRSFGVDFFLAQPEPQTFFQYVKAMARSAVRMLQDAFREVLILIGLEKRLTPFERVVSTMQLSIEADAVKRADVIEVTMKFPDRQAGVQVMSKLIDLYVQAHIEAFKTPGATQFLTQRLTELDKTISQLEARRRSFSHEESVWDLEEQRRNLLSRHREVHTAIARTREELARVSAELGQARSVLQSLPAERLSSRVQQPNPLALEVEQRLAERRVQLVRALSAYGDQSQRVLDLKEEIQELEALLASHRKPVTSSETYELAGTYRDVERASIEKANQLAGLKSAEERQRQVLAHIESELSRLEEGGEEARRVQREIAQAEQSYQLYARRLEEARISEALDEARISNVSPLGPPTASIRPVSPKGKFLFLIAVGVGLLGAVGVFLLRDALRPVVHSKDTAIDILGAPVLARLQEVR